MTKDRAGGALGFGATALPKIGETVQALRWITREGERVLQMALLSRIEGGAISYEWEDVPTEEEGA